MELKIIQSKLGPLTVVERIKNIWKIKCYICRDDKGLYLCKIYKFPECEKAYKREVLLLSTLTQFHLTLDLLSESKSHDSSTLIFDYSSFYSLDFSLQGNLIADLPLLITNILTALTQLHSLHIIHNNLCIENIFTNHDFSIKIGGFEFSTKDQEIEEGMHLQEDGSSRSKEYQAPELLESGFEITTQADMWSFGCVIYQILRKDRPFQTLEEQMKGKWKENVDGVWKLALKKLFVVDPRARANCFDISAMLTAHQEKSQKKPSVFTAFFSKSTNSWVKVLTHNSDSSMNSETLGKLLNKAAAKPHKIHKFYASLAKRPKYHPKVCLRSLLLLDTYLFATLRAPESAHAIEFIDTVMEMWTTPQSKSIQKYFTGTSRQVVIEFCTVLKEKYRLCMAYSILGSWSECSLPTQASLADLLKYYSQISKFVVFIFNLNDLLEIYLDMIKAFVGEQQQMNLLFDKLFSSATDVQILENYSLIYMKNVQFLHQFYLKHPLVDISPSSSPSQAMLYQYSSNSVYSSMASSLAGPDISLSFDQDQSADEIELALTSDLEFGEIVGQGSSCTVYQGRYRDRPVAIKVMKRNSKDGFMREFNREVQTLSKLRHPNLVALVGACMGERCCIVTEFCAGGTLFQLLHERKDIKLSWKQRVKFAKDIAEGMAYLHAVSPPIIHRDLKSLNLLLAEAVNGPEDVSTVKITDFGVSRLVTDEMMTGFIGTCHWMAPEILTAQPYGLPSDVYSYGIVLWEILARETPYKGVNPNVIPYHVTNLRKRPDLHCIANSCPKEIKEIMNMCWDQEPSARPTFQQIIQMLGKIEINKH